MDDLDKALDALKVQIKKEIVDNYFAERCKLEDDHQALEEQVAAYRQERAHLSGLFSAFYAALRQEAAIDRVMQLLSLADWPFYDDFRQMPPAARDSLLAKYPARGFTAWGRYFYRVLDIYQDLAARCQSIKKPYDKTLTHLHLLNEAIQKFNNSFDFSLIAAQVEAMDGGGEPICGGLLSGEREELSTRMRFKHKKLTEEELPPPPPVLPPLNAVRGQFKAILKKYSP